MPKPQFAVQEIGPRIYAINDRNRTVATVSSHGDIDWRLRSPLQNGPLLTSVPKETHLAYTLGLKITLFTPTPATLIKSFSWRFEEGTSRLVLIAHSQSPDGNWLADTTATLRTDEAISQYQWDLETIWTCTAKSPVELKGVEYCNVYPAKAGRCFLYAPDKEFTTTLMTDRDGVTWAFPHQHMMHYTGKINPLRFADGAMAGFFGESTGSPVVILKKGAGEPDWGICDMYYDLHCMARVNRTVQPGERLRYQYEVKYLNRVESEKLLASSRPVTVTDEDRKSHDYPRIELGLNSFDRPCQLDRLDDSSGFRPRPPQRVWDKEVGHSAKGSLRITNEKPEEFVWTSEPPTMIPNKSQLQINAMVKTKGVVGKGAFVRVRYHTWHFLPTPHTEFKHTLETTPVTGTSDGWIKVSMPILEVPQEDFDFLIYLEVVLDGKGTAWFTDVDVDLQPLTDPAPSMEEGSKGKRKAPASTRSTSSAGAAK